MQGELNFIVPYTSKKVKKVAEIVVPVSGVTIKGACFSSNSDLANIQLSWDKGLSTFEMVFSRTDQKWDTSGMNYTFDTKDKVFREPDQELIQGGLKPNKDLILYQAKVDESYKCASSEKVEMENDVVVKFSKVQLQPFPLTNGKFEKAHICTDDQSPSSVVPIAVGCALAGLVVIVLIAYFIGRRKVTEVPYQQHV